MVQERPPEEEEAALDTKETRLLKYTERLDSVRGFRDVREFDLLARPDVILHADGITLQQDVKGLDALKDYFHTLFRNYEFNHALICSAVNENDSITFKFWVEEDVTPNPDIVDTDAPDWAQQPGTIFGMSMYQFDVKEKLSDIWFLRQLTPDEQYRKFKKPVDYSKIHIDPIKYTHPSPIISAERAQKLEQVTRAYAKMWATGDVAPANAILTDDTRYANLMVPHEVNGREGFKGMVKVAFKHWKCTKDEVKIATTAGNKAFCYWDDEGLLRASGKRTRLYGFSLLLFDEVPGDHVKEVVEFRQLLDPERERMLKPEV
ncbi:hypothetical protein WJX72_002935 [[Myrmecia] bisecta]|uniref:SnoaL-like domain-containing protein n=1 Tax=[Myrmecia] bisecta TaxID=41462 RepID=A0AAW1QPT2_9CHLO